MAELPNRSLLGDAQRVLDFLRRNPDLDRSGHCRFAKQCQSIMAGTESIIQPSRPDFQLVLQAERDLAELNFALDVLGEAFLVANHKAKLARIMLDPALVQDGGNDTPGRDHQLELFILAILKRGGLRPQWREKGWDIDCRTSGEPVAVEAKRIKSLERRAVERRIHVAAEQIESSGLPGFICFDISLGARPAQEAVVNPDPRDLAPAPKRRMLAFLDDYREKLHQAIGDRPVLGIVFVDSLPVQEGINPKTGAGRWVTIHNFDKVTWHARDRHEKYLQRKFFEHFTYGLPRYEPRMRVQ